MHLTKEDILSTPKIKRLNIINSITGIKPANLIGSRSMEGDSNLAIFSSVVHLGSNPALLGFVLRPKTEVRRHTYENITDSGFYTINHIPITRIERAHYTSAKFEKDESEFEKCGFTEEYIKGFEAPYVGESPLKIGMRHLESVPIKANETILVIGEILHLHFDDDIMDSEGHLDLEKSQTAGISGLNSYYELKKIGQFPYARKSDLPF